MRIPFIPKMVSPETEIRPELQQFINKTRGGSAFLLAGSLFWLVGALVSLLASRTTSESYVIYAGIAVPIVAIIIGKLIHSAWLVKSPYATLAAIMPFVELAAIPILIFVRPLDWTALVGILMICEAVHYLPYMWLHMDYTYYLLFNIKVVLGILFMFGVLWHGSFAPQMALSGVISLISALMVYRDSGRLLAIYRK